MDEPDPFAVDENARTPPALASLLLSFTAAMRARGLSDTYLRTFPTHLSKLSAFMQERGITCLADLGPRNLQGFLTWLTEYRTAKQKPLSPAAKGQVVAILRSFLKWAYRTGVLAADVSGHLPTPRLSKPLPRAVPTPDEVALLIRARKQSGDALALRDASIIAVLFACGLRCKELTDLRTDDVDLSEREVRVRSGKGGTGRTVPIAVWASELVAGHAKTVTNPSPGFLFTSNRGRKLSTEDVRRVLTRACEESKLGRKITPHALRHAFCLSLLKGGAPIRIVNALAGHATLSMTGRYTKLTVDDLAKAVRKSHPRRGTP